MVDFQENYLRANRQEEQERVRQLANDPDVQARLNKVREEMQDNIKWKNYLIAAAVVAGLVIILFKMIGIIIVGLLYFFVYRPKQEQRKAYFAQGGKNNEDLYAEEFLKPILQKIFPRANVGQRGSLPLQAMQKVTPKAEKYQPFFFLSLGDEQDTRMCNLYSSHKESRTETRDGKEYTETVTVTDFVGQVFSIQLPVNFNGQLRVIPTKKSLILKKEVQDRYPGTLPGEKKIDVEDIQHNENYNIYCSDELSARKFLSPRVLTWFDEHISQNSLCVYLEGNKLYISLYTNNFIFPTPKTPEDVDRLSIEKEYKELRNHLDFLLDFTKVFQG